MADGDCDGLGEGVLVRVTEKVEEGEREVDGVPLVERDVDSDAGVVGHAAGKSASKHTMRMHSQGGRGAMPAGRGRVTERLTTAAPLFTHTTACTCRTTLGCTVIAQGRGMKTVGGKECIGGSETIMRQQTLMVVAVVFCSFTIRLPWDVEGY